MKQRSLINFYRKLIAPPPNYTISEWADTKRMLSPEASAEPGHWRTDRAEYQREMMDAINNPLIERVTVMSSAQVGKTEILNNIIGYFIEHDPAPMLIVQPTLEMAQAWSKDRFAPMIRDMPELRARVSDVKSKDGGNTILHKTFPGGHLTGAGANSAASLAARPVRVVLFDEVDRYPPSAGTEGDPVKLGSKRTNNFWNRKLIYTSTPTVAGVSRIESLYMESDQRRYFVPCPECKHLQTLKWGQVKWDRDAKGKNLMETVHYECENCKAKIPELKKYEMVKEGKWQAQNPAVKDHAGFHINELYSPWSTWRKVAEEFLEAKKRPETLKVWKNTTLGETFEEEQSFVISDESLASRIEQYTSIPEGCFFLTAGCDIQDDRIECVIKGWGLADESWFISKRVFYGDTATDRVYGEVMGWLDRPRDHVWNFTIKVRCVCIDSGHRSTQVYKFVKSNQKKGYFAIKGLGGSGKKFIGQVTYNNKSHARFVALGVDEAKQIIYDRLAIDTPGPGYMHFNETCDEAYFQQLTSEKRITKYSKGFPTRVWQLMTGRRNEMLDCEVYALAAYHLANPPMEKLSELAQAKAAKVQKPVEEEVNVETGEITPQKSVPLPRPRPTRTNYVNSWKR
jgi:phage terminase large subunit GpA-like protein